MIALDKALAAGDVISFTGNANSAYEICFMADNTYSNAEATSGHTYTIPASSALVGSNILYVSHAQGSNTYINSLTITRPTSDDDPETPTGITTVSTSEQTAKSTIYDLMGRRISTPQKGQIYIKNGKKHVGR